MTGPQLIEIVKRIERDGFDEFLTEWATSYAKSDSKYQRLVKRADMAHAELWNYIDELKSKLDVNV